MTAIDELLAARDELVLLMATLDARGATAAKMILERVERALEILGPLQ